MTCASIWQLAAEEGSRGGCIPLRAVNILNLGWHLSLGAGTRSRPTLRLAPTSSPSHDAPQLVKGRCKSSARRGETTVRAFVKRCLAAWQAPESSCLEMLKTLDQD